MAGSIIGERYAKALLGIGVDSNSHEQMGRELTRVAALFEFDAVKQLFANPKFDAATRKAVLGDFLAELTVSPTARNFLFLLVDRNRIANLPEIVDAYNQLCDDATGKVRAKVKVAKTLSDADMERLRAVLQTVSGRNVVVEQEVDPSLIGGVVTHLDGRVYDGSIKNQLETMRASLKQRRV